MLFYIIFFLISCVYAVFSYILTEPNLVLSSNPTYWNFQLYLWKNFYSNHNFIAGTFIFILFALFFCYMWIYINLSKKKIPFFLSFRSKYFLLYLFCIIPFLLSYNALSHDIFNYIFNAKMVLVYGANPHVQTALDFIEIDSWVRFMHNIHTTAPYGYGWTILSLIPSFFAFEKFLPTLLLFRFFMMGSILFLYVSLQHLSQTINQRRLYLHELFLVFMNPLLLLEVVSNYHNDIWMMAPAVLSVSILLRILTKSKTTNSKKYLFWAFLSAIVLIVFSISIKLVTVLLIPLFIFGLILIFFLHQYSELISKRFMIAIPPYFISRILLFFVKVVEKYVPIAIAILLFIPLFTARSQQFLPWYLLWVLVWVPFIKSKTVKTTIIVFSFSSLLRYVPWLDNSFEYSSDVLFNQKLIQWGIPALYLVTKLKDTIHNIHMIGKR